MPPISVMLKPASADCNLRCDYCFYRALAKDRAQFSKGKMSDTILLSTVQKALSYASDGSFASFTLQGGEPLLCGKEFLSDFFKTIRIYREASTTVQISLQTNGTLLTEDICALLKENNVLVGLSLDGRESENLHRKSANGENSFSQIMQAAALLTQYGIDFNIVSVVTEEVATNAEKIYNFFKAKGFRYLQFIPCLPSITPLAAQSATPISHKNHAIAHASDEENELTFAASAKHREDFSKNCGKSFAPSGVSYAKFLNDLFRCYAKDFFAGDYVSIRQFDNYVQLLAGRSAEQCGFNGTCSPQYVVEADGSVYPCDFYCTDPYLLGNICDTDFANLSRSATAKRFLSERSLPNAKCNICPHFHLCRGGGCKRAAMTDYCAAYQNFFSFATEGLREIARSIRQP